MLNLENNYFTNSHYNKFATEILDANIKKIQLINLIFLDLSITLI